MKFLSFLSNVLFAYSAAASVVFRSIEASRDVSDDVRDPARLAPRVDDGTPRYSKVRAANPRITTGQRYAFMLTWANNDGRYASDELKAYCESIGFKHKAVLVGYAFGGGRHVQDFTGKVFDLVKNEGDKGLSVDKNPRPWVPDREEITFLGEIRSSLKDHEISALGQRLITGKHYTPDVYDCETFAKEFFDAIKA